MNKFLTSSADPNKISLFIKSVAALLVILGVDATVVELLQVEVLNLITAVLGLISAGTAVWGLARKVWHGRWAAE